MMATKTVPAKDRLRNAAKTIIVHAGLPGCTCRSVAKEAQSSVAQINKYFSSHENLILDVYDSAWQLISASLVKFWSDLDQAKKSPAAAFGILLDAVLMAWERDRELIQAMAVIRIMSPGTALHGQLKDAPQYSSFANSFREMAGRTVEPPQLDFLLEMVMGAIDHMVFMTTPLAGDASRCDASRKDVADMMRRAVRGMVAGVTAK